MNTANGIWAIGHKLCICSWCSSLTLSSKLPIYITNGLNGIFLICQPHSMWLTQKQAPLFRWNRHIGANTIFCAFPSQKKTGLWIQHNCSESNTTKSLVRDGHLCFWSTEKPEQSTHDERTCFQLQKSNRKARLTDQRHEGTFVCCVIG